MKPNFLQEVFESESDLTKVSEMYSVVQGLGIPFLKRYASMPGYAICLVENDSRTFTWTRITQLPALRLLEGNTEEAVRLCQLYLEAYKDQDHALATGFREYAARFLKYLGNL